MIMKAGVAKLWNSTKKRRTKTLKSLCGERELSNQAGIHPPETKFNNLKTNLLHTTTGFLTSRKGHVLIFVSSPCCFCRRML